MAENESIFAPDLERVERGDHVATADALNTLHLRLLAAENELRLAKAKGIAANIPMEPLLCTADTPNATLGTYDIYHPRTGKISTRLGPLGYIKASRGAYVQSEGGIIIGGESAYGTGFFENYFGYWYLAPGQEDNGGSNTGAGALCFLHKQGTIADGGTSRVDHVVEIRHEPSAHPFEEYAFCPPRTPSGFGAARASCSVGSLVHADHAFERGVFKNLWITENGSVIDNNNPFNDGINGLGAYTTYAYNSAHFTASVGTWTVDNGDEIIRYMRFGKMMHIMGNITETDVSNACQDLYLTLPGGATVNGSVHCFGTLNYNDAGAASQTGRCFAIAGDTRIVFQRDGAANWTATSGDDTYLYFNVLLEIA